MKRLNKNVCGRSRAHDEYQLSCQPVACTMLVFTGVVGTVTVDNLLGTYCSKLFTSIIPLRSETIIRGRY